MSDGRQHWTTRRRVFQGQGVGVQLQLVVVEMLGLYVNGLEVRHDEPCSVGPRAESIQAPGEVEGRVPVYLEHLGLDPQLACV